MCLVKNCGCYTKEVISAAIEQMHRLSDWKVCDKRFSGNSLDKYCIDVILCTPLCLYCTLRSNVVGGQMRGI